MRVLAVLAFAASIAVSPAGAQAPHGAHASSPKFQAGTHYEVLSSSLPTGANGDEVEIVEVFWYGCGHCAALEPHIAEWRLGKPDYVRFVRLPVVWNPVTRLHARAFYAAEALGKLEEIHGQLFAEIHSNGNPLDSEDKLADLFTRAGVDPEAFRQALHSADVESRVQRAEQFIRDAHIELVPSVVVDGPNATYTSSALKAGGYAELVELMEELAASAPGAN